MKKEKQNRDAVVIVRLRTDERDAVKNAAKDAGTTMSDLFRTTTLTHISKISKKV